VIKKAYLKGDSTGKNVTVTVFRTIKEVAGFDYANYEYVPKICSAACEKAENEGTYLPRIFKSGHL